MKIKTRIYVQMDFQIHQDILLPDDISHHLKNVLRAKIGDKIGIFNGTDGEYGADITHIHKKSVQIRLQDKIKPHLPPENITLLFAMIKKTPLEFMVQKCTELGIGHFQPVITDYTVVHDINIGRLQDIAVQAAEQCGLTALPTFYPPISLYDGLKNYSAVLFCDETGGNLSIKDAVNNVTHIDSILIGPEGGFSPAEHLYLKQQPQCHGITLGKRILRAETAAIAASAWVLL